jgi:hypothetical protein
MRENERTKEKKERTGHRGQTEILFLIYPVLLEKSRRDYSNHILKVLTFRSHIYIFIYFDDKNKMKIELVICVIENKC